MIVHLETYEDRRLRVTSNRRYRLEISKPILSDPSWDTRQRSLGIQAHKRAAYLSVINEIKGTQCVDCEQTFDSSSLHYHHLNPATKKSLVSTPKPLDQALAEIKKCVVLCRWCHMRRHYPQGLKVKYLTVARRSA